MPSCSKNTEFVEITDGFETFRFCGNSFNAEYLMRSRSNYINIDFATTPVNFIAPFYKGIFNLFNSPRLPHLPSNDTKKVRASPISLYGLFSYRDFIYLIYFACFCLKGFQIYVEAYTNQVTDVSVPPTLPAITPVYQLGKLVKIEKSRLILILNHVFPDSIKAWPVPISMTKYAQNLLKQSPALTIT